MTNFCTKCGSKANFGVKFCTSCGNKLTNEPEVKDKDGLTASERAIIDSIDYDKIAAEAVANHDQIVADAVNKVNAQKGDMAKKHRRNGIIALVFGIIFTGGSFIALDTLGFFFLLAGGLIFLVFAVFMFILSRQTKQQYEEWKKTQQK